MAQATFSIRMDENLKREFDCLCDSFGMSMTTAINVFARAVVRERRIPFEITAEPPSFNADWDNFLKLSEMGVKSFKDEPTLEEINAEINAVRNEIR